MDKPLRTEAGFQIIQQNKDGSYLLKENDTAVVIRFSGSNSLNTQLAYVFSSMIKQQIFPLDIPRTLW